MRTSGLLADFAGVRLAVSGSLAAPSFAAAPDRVAADTGLSPSDERMESPLLDFPFESALRRWPRTAAGASDKAGSGELDSAEPLPGIDGDDNAPPALGISSPVISRSASGVYSSLSDDDDAPEPPVLGIPQRSTRNQVLTYIYDKTTLGLKESTLELFNDYRNFWSYRSVTILTMSLATSASLANTTADQHFQNWNDAHIQSPLSNHVAQDFKMLGNGMNTIPVFVVAAFSGPFLEESIPEFGPLGQWGNRSLQAMLAAGPFTLFFNQAIGSSRPVAGEGSAWHPFHDDHGVSGHAFMGAIPFLTAASMVDNFAIKVALFMLSFGTGWSRINDDQHYLSEVVMGWSLAYMGVDAVNRTKDDSNSRLSFGPAMLNGGAPGIQLAYRF